MTLAAPWRSWVAPLVLASAIGSAACGRVGFSPRAALQAAAGNGGSRAGAGGKLAVRAGHGGVGGNTGTQGCGNGIVEPPEECDGSPVCGASCRRVFEPSLVRRYNFDGRGTVANDAFGNGNATIYNSALDGTGSLRLAGGVPNQYVDLPNGSISSLVDATFEVWVRWNGTTQDHARIFDFGSSSGGEGEQGARSGGYLYLTPAFDDQIHRPQASFTVTGSNPAIARSSIDMPAGIAHMAVVFDDGAGQMRLYVDGVRRGATSVSDPLARLNDNNVWLGRSQFAGDHTFDGVLYEFRIYATALDDAAIARSFAAGSDPK